MTLLEALSNARRVFLDSSPVIYFVENHPVHGARMQTLIDWADNGRVVLVTSPITLAECMVGALKRNRPDISAEFVELIKDGEGTSYVGLENTAEIAASIRAEHGLGLLDSFQVACARREKCDALLTNDRMIGRVSIPRVIMLDDLTG